MANAIIETIPVGLFQCNCVILGDLETRKALVIDPGGDEKYVLSRLQHHGLTVDKILHTHSHIDHIGATTILAEKTMAKVCLHREDLFLYEKMEMQAQFLNLPLANHQKQARVDEFLIDGYQLDAGSIKGVTLHSPGHTPGSCGFFFPQLAENGLLIAGDTLFAGSIGRTDLWKGDYETEIQSIKKKYFVLEDEVKVICGHGPTTTIGFEKENNPFLC